MPDYLTRELVAVREIAYGGRYLQAGDRFTPLSDIDADYLTARGRAFAAAGFDEPGQAPIERPAPPPVDNAFVAPGGELFSTAPPAEAAAPAAAAGEAEAPAVQASAPRRRTRPSAAPADDADPAAA